MVMKILSHVEIITDFALVNECLTINVTSFISQDPNMPPAYEDAVNAPHMPDGPPTSAGNPAYAPPSDNSTAPYPTQPAPYPTQPAPYPVQQTPYPPQQQTPYPPPSNDNQQPAAYPPPAAGAPQY